MKKIVLTHWGEDYCVININNKDFELPHSVAIELWNWGNLTLDKDNINEEEFIKEISLNN